MDYRDVLQSPVLDLGGGIDERQDTPNLGGVPAGTEFSGATLQVPQRECAKAVDAFKLSDEDCEPGRRAGKGMLISHVVPGVAIIIYFLVLR